MCGKPASLIHERRLVDDLGVELFVIELERVCRAFSFEHDDRALRPQLVVRELGCYTRSLECRERFVELIVQCCSMQGAVDVTSLTRPATSSIRVAEEGFGRGIALNIEMVVLFFPGGRVSPLSQEWPIDEPSVTR